MTSITTFAYGLTVRATGLITAAQAWPSLEPIFEFFDLIFLRKRKGTLQSRMMDSTVQGIVGNVPVEVWEEIRKWLVVIEMEDAEDKLLSPFWWPICAGECVLCERGRYTWNGVHRDAVDKTKERWLSNDKDFNNFVHGFVLGSDKSLEVCHLAIIRQHVMLNSLCLQPIHHFLTRFGLAHPLARMITYSHKHRDLNAVAFISLPVRTSGDPHTFISAEAGGDVGPDEHSMVNVSLELPQDSNSRFARFIRIFNLEVVQITTCTLKIGDSRWKVKEGSESDANTTGNRVGEHGIKQDRVAVTKEVKPGWKLYTSCTYDFTD
ncbi:hypothetical protein JCM5353_004525 [Sporobolomyces roseus]